MNRLQKLVVMGLVSASGLMAAQLPPASQPDTGGSLGTSAESAKDKVFLRQAAEGNLAEVEMGKLALTKATTDEIKTYAQKMVDDHTLLQQKQESQRERYGVRTPSKIGGDSKALYDKLSALSGDQFEQEYISTMVTSHLQAIRLYKQEIKTTQDHDLKAQLGEEIQIIAEHAQGIVDLAKERNIPLPHHHREYPSKK